MFFVVINNGVNLVATTTVYDEVVANFILKEIICKVNSC